MSTTLPLRAGLQRWQRATRLVALAVGGLGLPGGHVLRQLRRRGRAGSYYGQVAYDVWSGAQNA
ncbi:hypothetical protein [Actinophytocola algeriensis]|uniref:Uncharacterized protein n=1 Tax=Actinophytocola algeriensis TaxID=1768010 RepID=A0A7W7Q931_9PSEU|nr:hypothetical protein [Actinophytocola algeriensis]MBB4909138.1 hypothetical protein [Actinophytocola algeriensis]MBE1474474.1 hypothetical protein [Actinophytocola algeriensis]